ncbi:hypothetical protein CRENBAI_016311 [Crenichthys baileyi]|uniref:Uncharacterized protein n=1 Tax=Crenichthys baileyi TaxID=28760 RepID=A0AAV9RTD1_9TELE
MSANSEPCGTPQLTLKLLETSMCQYNIGQFSPRTALTPLVRMRRPPKCGISWVADRKPRSREGHSEAATSPLLPVVPDQGLRDGLQRKARLPPASTDRLLGNLAQNVTV